MLLIVEILFIVLLTMILFMLYKNEHLFSKKVVPLATVEEFWSGAERRKAVRFKKDLTVHYAVEKRPHLKTNGKTVDISESGVKILIDEKLTKGTTLDIMIAIPGSGKQIEAEGEIVWSEEANEPDASGKRFFHAGVRFSAIREPNGTTLREYIRSLCTDLKS